MTTLSMNPRRTNAAPADRRSLWLPAAVAGVLAAVVNAAIFAAAVAAGLFPALRIDPAAGPQMGVEPVVLVSLLGAAAGVAAFGVLRRRAAQPVRAFLRLAGVVLLLSFAAPFAMPGGFAQAMLLNLLHLTTAAVVVGTVLRVAR